MKAKLSATVEKPLVRFLDSLPGKSRSEKLERALSMLRQWQEERELRRQLAAVHETKKERQEREDWERLMAEAMWTK
ncbi:MAG: hypothetical protein HY203_00755 [Nitrospirae bacterium]|nr:hypothetical protein [Nitrospirota bacterium]